MDEKLPNGPQNSERANGIKSSEVTLPVKSLSLDEKLEAFAPAKHGCEYLAAEPVGPYRVIFCGDFFRNRGSQSGGQGCAYCPSVVTLAMV